MSRRSPKGDLSHAPPRRFAVRAAALAGACVLAPFSACKNTPTDGFQLEVPSDVASKVAWYEIGIFAGSTCGSLAPQLAGGVPADGYLQRLAFQASNRAPPGIPNLPRARYAIGVAARAADCSVLATGCSNEDLASVSSVTVVLNDVSGSPRGACTDGASCNAARCTPSTTNPSAGGGCSLQLLGAGPFADPFALLGTLVSAPAIAATPSGFVIAYRELDPSAGQARITVLPIDTGGGAGAVQQTPQTACVSYPLSDATGIVFRGSSGLVADARGVCGVDAGIDLFPFDATAAFGASAFADLGPSPVTLSTGHSIAISAAGTFIAFAQDGLAKVASLNGATLGTASTFGVTQASGAWVSASDQAIGLLAAGTGSAAPPAGGSDASASGDDSGLAGDDASTPTDTGGTPSDAVLAINVLSTSGGATLTAIPAPIQFPGTWGAVAAQAGRVFVVSDGATAAKPIAYRAFDLGGTAAAVDDGFAIDGLGQVSYADVAFQQDHVFFAVESAGAIDLVAFDHATTTPTLLRQVALAGDGRVPSIAKVRDGRLAVLATDTRVVVAWATGQQLSGNDAVGGYAVFACTTP